MPHQQCQQHHVICIAYVINANLINTTFSMQAAESDYEVNYVEVEELERRQNTLPHPVFQPIQLRECTAPFYMIGLVTIPIL